MDHNRIIKEQILHVVFGVAFFAIIGVFAVALNLASGFSNNPPAKPGAFICEPLKAA